MTNDKEKMRKKHEREDLGDALETTVLRKADGTQVWPPKIDLNKFVRASDKLEAWTHEVYKVLLFADAHPELYRVFLTTPKLALLEQAEVSDCLDYAGADRPVKHVRADRKTTYASAHHAVIDAKEHLQLIANAISGNETRDEELEAASRFFKEDEYFEFDWEALRVQMRHERAKIRQLLTQAEPKQAAKAEPEGKNKAAKAIETLLDEPGEQVLKITRSKKSSDSKMREICRIDTRFLGFDSPHWSRLLGVSEAAIRKTTFWKVDRPKAIEADRA